MTQYPGSLLQADLPVLNTSDMPDMPGEVPLPPLPCHKESCDQLGGALNLPTYETNPTMGLSGNRVPRRVPSNPTIDHQFPIKDLIFLGWTPFSDTPTWLGNVWK